MAAGRHFDIQLNGYNAVAITNIRSKFGLGTKYNALETVIPIGLYLLIKTLSVL